VNWFKSSKSGPYSDNCVEIAFKTSSYTDDVYCVEVGTCDCPEVHMRDSKDKSGPTLTFDREVFVNFISGVKNNEFNL